MDNNKIIKGALLGALALGLGTSTILMADAKAGKVKCYGIAKAGHNDCGNGVHDCHGKATKDNDPHEWVNAASAKECTDKHGKLEAPKK